MIRVAADEWLDVAAKLKAADKKVAARLRKGLRAAGEEIGKVVQQEGPQDMPNSGGLRDYLLNGTKPRVAVGAKGVNLILQGSTKKGLQLAKINAGEVRHPVFGRKWLKGGGRAPWAKTTVPEGTWTDAFHKSADEARKAILEAMERISEELS